MKEISIKAKLGDNKERVVFGLDKKGAKSKKGKEELEKIFVKSDVENLNLAPGDNLIKLKQEENKVILSLNQKSNVPGKDIIVESLVSDEEEITKIINLIGFKEIVKINKKRTKYVLSDFYINLDYIDGLDYFIEIKKLYDEAKESEENAYDSAKELMFDLGLNENDFVFGSYEELKFKNENK